MSASSRRLASGSRLDRLRRFLDAKSRRSVFKRRLMIESLENRRVLANFEVTSLLDTTDATDGVITLREAIASANEAAGADTITFAPSLSGSIVLTQGELPITDSVQIVGPGSGLLAIDANQQSRVIAVQSDRSLIVSLEGLTIRDGKTTANNENGAGIRFNSPGGRLGLVDSVISGNLTEGIAAQGGGIYASRGDVVLTRSTVQGNQTSNGSSSGGGIATVYANVSLIDSKVLNNRTLGQQAFGGGVFTVSGAVALTGSTVSGNSTAGDIAYGGGIRTFSGAVTLTGSTVSGNRTAGRFAYGGGIFTRTGAVTLTGSTVSGNSTAGDRAHGGGIYTGFGAVTLTGSTVSGNRVTGTNSDGGGVWFNDSVVTIVNSTITANSATRAGGGLGMLVDATDKKLTILNSIIAGNTATSNPDFTAPSTPATKLEVRSSLIGNLQGTTLTPAATANTNGNLIGDPNATPPVLIDPKLGPLGFNGGATQTHALLPGSPAINAGNNGLVASQTNDQRGAPFVRQSGVVDIGAYELQTLDSNFFIVTTLNDELDYSNSHVSLREAINSGNGSPGADTITFAPGLSGSILLSATLGQLPITDSVQIDGHGASNTIVNAGRQGFRVIDVMGQNVDVTINGMTITGGQTVSSGGGINFVSEGRLTVNNSTISGNASELSGGGVSSGSGGTATFNNSTLSDNSAATGGGLFNFGTAIFNNSTLSGNSSLNEGGGLYNSGVALLSHTTLSGNTASIGGGLRINGGTTRLQNSIVAGNTSGGDISGNVDPVTSSSNLIGDPASAGGLTHGTTGNILGTANGSGRALIDITTVLGPLAFNGGTTMTHALVTNSPAINAGNNTLIVTGQNNDQRGNPFARIFNDDVDRVDIGAYEFQTFAPSSFVVTTLADELDFTNATVSLREAIHVANGNPGIDTITFDNSLTSAGPATITLTQGELLITDSVTIVGAPVTSPATPGETLLTVDANRLSRIVNVKGTATKPVDLTIEGLTLTGGNIANGEGAGILFDSAGKLNLTDSTVSSSRTTGENGFGAGIYTDSGEITLLRSKVSGNGTEGFNALGGGIHSYSGKLLLNDSLISENYTRGAFAAGGGIVVGSAEVVLSNSIVESNFTTGADAIGGGITSFGGLLTLENGSKVRGNRTQGANAVGGGIAKFSGDLLVTASEVVSNFVQGENSQGGGIFSQSGDVRIDRSLVSGNATEAANSPGGGISVDTGQVILVQSTISDNSTQQNNSIGGGIFSNRGNVLLDRSTMSGNSTNGNSAAGGGIASNSGDIRVVNSTVSGNQTAGIDSSGGGLWTLLGDVTLLNSTVAFNQTAANAKGGGLFVNFDSGQNLGSLTIQNSIVARNSVATTGEGPDLFLQNFQATTILSVVHSLIGNNANTTLMAAPVGMPVSQFSLIGTAATPIDPLLGPLAFNGGPTQTHALLQGSPAINKGNDALATTISDDQRGAPFGRKNGVVDMGAYELQTLGASFFIVTTLDDELDYSNSAVSLREAINSANGSPGVETITFASTVNGSINLSPTLGQLQITNSVNITGNGAASTIVDAGRQGFRVIEVIGSLVDVSLTGVTITGGQTTGNGGGINFASTGKLTVNNSTLSGNSATDGGGLFNGGALTLTNSTLSGNSATNSGGGLFNRGDATVTNSTFSGNSALNGGGAYNRGALTLTNNTLSGNSARRDGGGLWNSTTVTLTNNTLSGNSATNGGGGISNGNQATLNNNIVANSVGGDLVTRPSVNARFVGSSNLVGPGLPATGSLGNLTFTFVGDPKLGPLQDNGGPTFTHALLAGSPALDAGRLPAGITTDQRGVARIIDLPGITVPNASPVDIGAVEMVGVSIADVSANENAGTLDFVVTLSHAIPVGLTVSVQVDTAAINGGATAGVDYTAIANQTVTFTSADPLTKTVSVTIANDLIDEANETFQVNLSNASGAIITRASAIGTITDDDVRGITVSAISGNTTEAGDTATFTVVLTSQPTADVTIPLSSSDTTEGTVAPATLTFTPASWNVAQTVTVTGVNDDIDDGDIAFNIITAAATGGDYAGLDANDVSVNNVDNDAPPIVTLSRNNANIEEAGGTSTITAMLSIASSQSVTIALGFSGTATLTDDFTFTATQIVIAPGQTSGSVNVTAVQDATDEVNETIIVDITGVTNGTEVTPQQVTVTITDDDEPLDFGDAPTAYPVTLAQNGARHIVGPLFLGEIVDDEVDGTPSVNADGDNDDDGVFVLSTIITTSVATTSSLSVIASQPGKIDGWIDFNRDGDWSDSGESIFNSVNVVPGTNLLSFTIPAGATSGSTGARFRLSTAGNLAPTGAAADGEVEDYLAVMVAGSSTAALRIDAPGGDTNVVVEGENLVVRQGTTIISRVPFASFGELNLNGSSLDDILQLTILEALATMRLVIDGGLGKDFLELVEAGQTLDLTNATVTIREIEGIDMRGTGNNTLVISIDSVKAASSTTDTLEVVSNVGDTITFGNGFQAETPRFIDGQFTHVISETATGGTARVEVKNDRFFTNPLNRFDVDRNGSIQPLDALRIINAIRRLGSGPLALPINDAEISNLYFDVSSDNNLTALDALRVINAISRINRGQEPEGESPLVDLDVFTRNNTDSHEVIDRAISEFEVPTVVSFFGSAEATRPNVPSIDDWMEELGSEDVENPSDLKGEVAGNVAVAV